MPERLTFARSPAGLGITDFMSSPKTSLYTPDSSLLRPEDLTFFPENLTGVPESFTFGAASP